MIACTKLSLSGCGSSTFFLCVTNIIASNTFHTSWVELLLKVFYDFIMIVTVQSKKRYTTSIPVSPIKGAYPLLDPPMFKQYNLLILVKF